MVLGERRQQHQEQKGGDEHDQHVQRDQPALRNRPAPKNAASDSSTTRSRPPVSRYALFTSLNDQAAVPEVCLRPVKGPGVRVRLGDPFRLNFHVVGLHSFRVSRSLASMTSAFSITSGMSGNGCVFGSMNNGGTCTNLSTASMP